MNCHKLFAAVICAAFVLPATSAVVLGQNGPAAYGLLTGNGNDSPLSFSESAAGQPQCAGCSDAGCGLPGCSPRWTASADFIILDRVGSVNQTLVERGTTIYNGVEVLNADDFHQGFCGGPQLGLVRHGDCGCDFELSYFQIDGWSNASAIDPDGEVLTFHAPGGFIQRPDTPTQPMQWAYDSKLYNAEFNVRWNACDRLTLLAGIRWTGLCEDLQGTLVDSIFKPFWTTNTENSLYGLQIGADGKLWDCGRFSIDGLLKAGIFDNRAEQTTAVSVFKIVTSYSDSTDRAAFLGEVGLRCKYQLAKRLVLSAGYEAVWLQGVAVAPAQIQETNITTRQIGIDTGSGVFYHGATAGLEYSF